MKIDDKVRHIFEKYIPTDKLDDLLNDLTIFSLTDSTIDFLLIDIPYTTNKAPENIITSICESLPSDFIVMSFLGTIIFTYLKANDSSKINCIKTANDLLLNFKDNIRIVHGRLSGQIGNFGSQKRMTYSFISSNFNSAIKLLLNTDIGDMEEFI